MDLVSCFDATCQLSPHEIMDAAAETLTAGRTIESKLWCWTREDRQSARADLPQDEVLSGWKRQRQMQEAELNRKLIICLVSPHSCHTVMSCSMARYRS